jgi:hypothetical protein
VTGGISPLAGNRYRIIVLERLGSAVPVDVTESDDVFALHLAQVVGAPPADPYPRDVQLVARGYSPVSAEYVRRKDHQTAETQAGFGHEAPTVAFV